MHHYPPISLCIKGTSCCHIRGRIHSKECEAFSCCSWNWQNLQLSSTERTGDISLSVEVFHLVEQYNLWYYSSFKIQCSSYFSTGCGAFSSCRCCFWKTSDNVTSDDWFHDKSNQFKFNSLFPYHTMLLDLLLSHHSLSNFLNVMQLCLFTLVFFHQNICATYSVSDICFYVSTSSD